MTQGEWLEIIRAGAPVLAALLAGGVAWKFGSIQAGIARQQAATAAAAAATAKQKLKLDLFDRRWTVYRAAVDTISFVLNQKEFPSEEEFKYLAAVQSSRWLFDDLIWDYLQFKLVAILNELHHCSDWTEDLMLTDSQADRDALEKRRQAAVKKVLDQLDAIEQIFAPYLRLEA